MSLFETFRGGMPHCKRCKVELDASEKVCPRCDFAPKQTGLRISGFALLAMMICVIGSQLSMVVYPVAGIVLLPIGAIAFVFALAMFLLSMVVTPYRLGGMFRMF